MEAIDNRSSIFELNEIYKYKNLIGPEDKAIIKAIICNGRKEADALHQEFLKLVEQEVDHKLNKAEFKVLKDKLIINMNNFLESE